MAADLVVAPRCRHCQTQLRHPFVDLGFAPPSNAYRTQGDLLRPELTFPLKVFVCTECWLVQTQDFADAATLFKEDYAYFSSTSQGWLAHAARYCESIAKTLRLDGQSMVIELASNDGYLLRNFVTRKIPCLGIEPTELTAQAARAQGVETLQAFFSAALAQSLKDEGKAADLIVANNVFAHVPDINDFSRGMQILLKPDGIVTLEFPSLLELLRHCQFDTIYHEHFSYLSLGAVNRILRRAGLRVWRVEALATHGGSLRVFACQSAASRPQEGSVAQFLEQERLFGLERVEPYLSFQAAAVRIKHQTLAFVLDASLSGKRIACYGAAAKGSTLLNFCGIKSDLIPLVCDAAPSKQGKFLPGSHIPVHAPEVLNSMELDYLWILPWNIADEVMAQVRQSQARVKQFLTTMPDIRLR